MSEKNSICCDEEFSTDFSTNIKVQKVPLLLKQVPKWSGIAVKDAQMYQISMQDFKDKYLILLFYPCDFTFICPSELIQFSDRIEEFRNIGNFFSSLNFSFIKKNNFLIISNYQITPIVIY